MQYRILGKTGLKASAISLGTWQVGGGWGKPFDRSSALQIINKAIDLGVETVQIIFNMFRLRPAELFFEQAKKRNVGVIVRVPLASGLLTGKFNRESRFDPDDHRFFNRDGQAFDKGETFSGVDYETGLQAVEQLHAVFPTDYTLAQYALR